MQQPGLTSASRESDGRGTENSARGKVTPGIVCLLLALVTFAAFSSVRNFDFINLDDDLYVTANPHVQSGLTLEGIGWAFTTGHASNWHPLTWLSLMLDESLFGQSAAAAHLVNLLLHVADTLLLFLVLRQMTGAQWRSAFVAALFALHPLHVESVAWVSERKDVLSTLFWMLTLWAYTRHVQKCSDMPTAPPRRRLVPWTFEYALALGFFALGLLAKPMLVTLPFTLLLLDYWPLGRVPRSGSQEATREKPNPEPVVLRMPLSTLKRLAGEKAPFFVLSALSCAVTFLAQKHGGAVSSLMVLPLGARMENIFVAYARYLGKLFWPVDLAIPYPYPGHWPLGGIVMAAALVVGLTVAALRFARELPYGVVGWFWFLGTLLPVIGLVQVGSQSLADRYTYVPSIGIFIVLAWGAGSALSRWRLPRVAVAAAAVLVLGACAARTMDQVRYWRDSGVLFRHAIDCTRDNAVAHTGLGVYLVDHGSLDQAIDNYRRAYQIDPNSPNLLNCFGNALVLKQQYPEAIGLFRAALRLRPSYVEALNNLGAALVATGHTGEAMDQYRQALRLDPLNAQAHFRLANALVSLGRNDEAIEHYQLAVQQKPDYVEARNNFGVALFNLGKPDLAEAQFREALRYEPGNALTHYDLGNVLSAERKWEAAAAEYLEATRLHPGFAEAHFGAGLALARLGRREEALAHLTKAVQLKPDYAQAKHLLEALRRAEPP